MPKFNLQIGRLRVFTYFFLIVFGVFYIFDMLGKVAFTCFSCLKLELSEFFLVLFAIIRLEKIFSKALMLCG